MAMVRIMLAKSKLAVLLWWQGIWEALQLHRCLVLLVLDGACHGKSSKLLVLGSKCFILNGLIYLGSLALHNNYTTYATQWLLETHAQPLYSHAVVAAWQQLLQVIFQGLWLGPLYGISLLVSCMWYQQIAAAAFEVERQQQQQQQQQQQLQQKRFVVSFPFSSLPAAAAAAAGSGPPPTAAVGSMMHVLEGTAQELFRVLLFLVFTAEVFIASLLPGIGPVLNVVLLSWLYSYYCFDYKWSLQGARLPQRLAFFEANWAFFAGFGFPCVIATVLLPFHIGAALANLLFPVFILVACASDPVAAQRPVLGPDAAKLSSIPIFKLPLWPTYWMIRKVFSS